MWQEKQCHTGGSGETAMKLGQGKCHTALSGEAQVCHEEKVSQLGHEKLSQVGQENHVVR